MHRSLSFVLVLVLGSFAHAQLKPGDKLAITGDSITEQKQYSVFIQDYLLMCEPVDNVRTMQFGWGGETSWGFLARLDNDCLQFKPTIATTCFGMNDGGYGPLNPERFEKYKTATNGLVDAFEKSGVRVVLGSPGVVDQNTAMGKNRAKTDIYNQTLKSERDAVEVIAKERGVAFADVYTPMMDVMQKAEAKYGAGYHVAGADGVHPWANGHLVMAYALLKALGCDGNIATITLDLSNKKATATEGQTVKSFDGNTLTIESSRYPFCFPIDPKLEGKLDDPNNTRGALEFLPFNAELNRYRLVISDPPANSTVKITWGNSSKQFSAKDAAMGVNLAAEFLDNPFVEQFRKVDGVVREQQNFETWMIKSLVHGVRYELPDEKKLLADTVAASTKKQLMLSNRAADAVVPVTHTITIEIK
ncbi:MAG: SGNH/GDSL hydrolase family protein [Anaerolineae bacterium]|nr:SGNH/GDSL hydrolase family protein [Phycisphaerae bacterium]